MRTNPGADGRQGIGLAIQPVSLLNLAFAQQADKTGDVVVNGASISAFGLFALQTALGLKPGSFIVVTKDHFIKIVDSLRHR